MKKQILRCLALLLLVLTVGNLLPQTPGGAFSRRAARSLGGPVEVQAVTASGGSGYNDGEDDHDHGAGIGAGCRYNDSTGKHEISTRGKLEFSNVTIYQMSVL